MLVCMRKGWTPWRSLTTDSQGLPTIHTKYRVISEWMHACKTCKHWDDALNTWDFTNVLIVLPEPVGAAFIHSMKLLLLFTPFIPMSWLSLRLYVAGMLEHTWTYYIWIRHEVSHLWTTIVSLAIEHWDWLGPSANVETSISYRPTMSHVTLEDWVGASTRPVLDRSSLLRTNGFQLASTLHRRPTFSNLLLGKHANIDS